MILTASLTCLGLAIGLGVGYYFGDRAGAQRVIHRLLLEKNEEAWQWARTTLIDEKTTRIIKKKEPQP